MSDALKHDAETHFEFGKNWARYGKTITPADIAIAEVKLEEFLGPEVVRGKHLLDIGCGSGIHTLAALRLGAGFVHGIDIDENSVATAQAVVADHWDRENWKLERGNIFEVTPETLGRFEIVYSWGVLHHTGDMWGAIRNAAGFVAPGGLFAIAIYRKTRWCDFWRWEKEFYTRSGKLYRGVAVAIYVALRFLRDLLRLRNPFKKISGHNRKRGMKWYTDVIDWIGGYPYESATPKEIGLFVETLGFRLERSARTRSKSGMFGSGNAEYLFRKV